MAFKDSKVVIVGCGNVGSTTAYTIINQGLAEEVVLIDVNKDKAYAEALDMAHSIYFMNRNIKVLLFTEELNASQVKRRIFPSLYLLLFRFCSHCWDL